MSTRTAIILAFILLAASFIIGLYWPNIWAGVWLLIAPLLTVPYRDHAPKQPTREVPDDSKATELEKSAADTDLDYLATRRRLEAIRARLRRRIAGSGSRPDGGGADSE